MKKQLVSALTFAAMLGTACSPENPRLVAPPMRLNQAEVEGKAQKIVVTKPKVDILLVIDDSDSMGDEQETLSKNIDRFANGLAKNSNVDFHIGVTSIWDSVTYKDMQKEYGHGQLRKLKDPKGKPLPENFKPFVSSTEDYDTYLAQQGFDLKSAPGWIQVLKQTMKIGIEYYNNKWKTEQKGGANIEQVFSPVKAALTEPMRNGKNAGFRRTDAHLVLIFITDTDAAIKTAEGKVEDLTSEQLQEFLRGEIGDDYQNRSTSIGVLAKSTDKPEERDPSIKDPKRGPTEPVSIHSFLTDVGGRKMGLRDKNYGDKMANLGDFVRERVVMKPYVDISGAEPEHGTLQVELAGEKLEPGVDWQYNQKLKRITILRPLGSSEGSTDIKVSFTAISASNAVSGRVQRVQ